MSVIPPAILAQARDHVEKQLLSDHAHTVYIGTKNPDGTGEPCIVVQVGAKLTNDEMTAQGVTAVPSVVYVAGHAVLTDVVQSPKPVNLRLHLDDDRMMAQAAVDHRICYSTPIPGGVQMMPAGASWVGTMGCGLSFRDADGKLVHGALTNAHVALLLQPKRGDKMLQPSGGDYFGTLSRWKYPDTTTSNRIDAAFIECRRTDGKYAPATDTVGREVLGVGPYSSNPDFESLVGTRVVKSGRTTGVTLGKCVGYGASARVGYDEGTALFTGQLVIKADSGDFSQPGDSGSLILVADTLRPWGLLFAGGGGITLANPIKDVLDYAGGVFFPA
jgi:hypothetical protein